MSHCFVENVNSFYKQIITFVNNIIIFASSRKKFVQPESWKIKKFENQKIYIEYSVLLHGMPTIILLPIMEE